MKEEEDPPKEAFDGGAFAQFLFGPGRRQAGAVLLALGIPGDDCNRMESHVDPSNEAQAPISGVQAYDARTDGVEAHGPLQQGLGKGGIMDISWRQQKEDGQARAATEQGMRAIAA